MSAGFHSEKANEITQSIAQAVVDDPKYGGRDWAGIAIVSIIEDGPRQLSGYSFDAQGNAQPGTPQNDDIDDLFVQLQKATAVEGKAPWVSALLQIKREGMRFGVDFEYENPLRWKMNPSRMDEIIASMRP